MATAIIGALVLGSFTCIVYKIFKDSKKGGTCGQGCAGCSHSSKCGH